jgi:hypothetical protein
MKGNTLMVCRDSLVFDLRVAMVKRQDVYLEIDSKRVADKLFGENLVKKIITCDVHFHLNRCRFHQHSTSSMYAHRSQKHK